MLRRRCAAAAAMLFVSATAVQPAMRLTAGFSYVPPLHYPDSQGRASGFTVDVITEAARRENIKISWKRVGGSNDIERALTEREIDIFPAGIVTESRRARYWVSEPWWSEDLSILVLARRVNEPGGWKGRRVVLGTPVYSAIAAQLLPGATFVLPPEYDVHGGPAASSSMVCESKADAALLAHSEVDELLARRPSACRESDFLLIEPKGSLPLAVISRHDAAALAGRLRGRLDQLARDGTLAAVAEHYPRIPARSAVALTEKLRLRYQRDLLWAGLVGAVILTLITSVFLARQLRIKRALDRAIAERGVSLAELQATFEGMVEPALLGRRDGRVVAINSAYMALFEFETPPKTGEELQAHFEFTNPDGSPLDIAQSPFTRALRGEVVRSMELKGRNKRTGTVFHILTGAAPVRRAEGTIDAVIITCHDITEKKKIEEQLRQSSKMEAIGRLAGGIAHDLNNVLQVIVSYAHLMEETGADHAESLQEITQASSRAADMTGRLLAFSRQQVMQPKLVGVDTHIQEQANFMRRLLTDEVRLELRLEAGPSHILIDPAHFDQVLMNLAANARHAMPRGGRLVLETHIAKTDKQSHPTLENGTYVTVCVADNGVGMTDDVRVRIFEPFFSTRKEQGGTGLGLATVYGIIKQSRGDIFVYSEPGRGTSFHIYLPEASGPAEELKAQTKLPLPCAGRERIVVVDDDLQIVRLIEHSLRQANYDVWATSDATATVEYVRAHRGEIDLIVTDVLMPAMNGRELAEEVARLDPSIMMMFMSGFPGDMQQGFLPANFDFLQKPFTAARLVEQIRSTMSRQSRPHQGE